MSQLNDQLYGQGFANGFTKAIRINPKGFQRAESNSRGSQLKNCLSNRTGAYHRIAIRIVIRIPDPPCVRRFGRLRAIESFDAASPRKHCDLPHHSRWAFETAARARSEPHGRSKLAARARFGPAGALEVIVRAPFGVAGAVEMPHSASLEPSTNSNKF